MNLPLPNLGLGSGGKCQAASSSLISMADPICVYSSSERKAQGGFTSLEYLGTSLNNGQPTSDTACIKGFDNAGYFLFPLNHSERHTDIRLSIIALSLVLPALSSIKLSSNLATQTPAQSSLMLSRMCSGR